MMKERNYVFFFIRESRRKCFQLQMDLQEKAHSTEKASRKTRLLEIDLKLFTGGFIHCFPLCEIPAQIKE